MNKKTGRPKGTKNKPGHKAGAVKKEPTKRMSIPLSKVEWVKDFIGPSYVDLHIGKGLADMRFPENGYILVVNK